MTLNILSLQKEEKGIDPSLTKFYFHTHRKQKDQSWVGPHAKHAFVSVNILNL